MQFFSNPELIQKKREKLLELFSAPEPADHLEKNFQCSYHGINLHLKSKTEKLFQDLELQLPRDWKHPNTSAFKVRHVSLTEMGFNPENWSQETLQDCFISDQESIVIQRDFAFLFRPSGWSILICEDELSDGFYNFLRWFLSRRMIDQNRFVLHASAIQGKSGKTHFFMGHSGAGKTTITSLSSPRKILGDDMNLILNREEQFFASPGAIGGQFRSDLNYGEELPIAAFYWLKQSSHNGLKVMSPALAQTKIMASFANLFWDTLPLQTEQKLMQISLKLAHQFPVYELEFIRSKDFWELLND